MAQKPFMFLSHDQGRGKEIIPSALTTCGKSVFEEPSIGEVAREIGFESRIVYFSLLTSVVFFDSFIVIHITCNSPI